jgi:hypothetical protein
MDLIGLVLVAGIIYLVVRLTRGGRLPRLRGGGPRRFKCHDCMHQRKLFDDGVMCGYGDREVFKNARHIALCPDWTPRRGR